MLRAVVAWQGKDLITEYGLIERCGAVEIARYKRTPDPLAGHSQHILRITAARLQDRKYRTLRISEYGLPTALSERARLRENLAAVGKSNPLGLIHILHGDEGQPRGLSVLVGSNRSLYEPSHGHAVEEGNRVVRVPHVSILEGPAEQAAIEALGAGQVGGDQVGPDHLTGMALTARRLDQRR